MIWRDRNGNPVEATYRKPLPPRTQKKPGDLVHVPNALVRHVEEAA